MQCDAPGSINRYSSHSDSIDLKNFYYDEQDKKFLNWRKMKVISVDETAPFVLQFQDNYEDDFKFVNTLKARGAALRPCRMPKKLSPVYSDELPIPYKKWKDLLSLCKMGVINEEYHSYYRNILHKAIDLK